MLYCPPPVVVPAQIIDQGDIDYLELLARGTRVRGWGVVRVGVWRVWRSEGESEWRGRFECKGERMRQCQCMLQGTTCGWIQCAVSCIVHLR